MNTLQRFKTIKEFVILSGVTGCFPRGTTVSLLYANTSFAIKLARLKPALFIPQVPQVPKFIKKIQICSFLS